MLGCRGSTTTSPDASLENATRPGPWAIEITMGMPPSMRFMPPPSDMADSGAASSFHNSTWCSKNTESPWARLISATGTSSPSTWQVLLENLNSVMSLSRGASFQPESLTRLRASSGAPQVPQVVCPLSFWALHHWHSIRSMSREGSTMSSPGGRGACRSGRKCRQSALGLARKVPSGCTSGTIFSCDGGSHDGAPARSKKIWEPNGGYRRTKGCE